MGEMHKLSVYRNLTGVFLTKNNENRVSSKVLASSDVLIHENRTGTKNN